MIGDIPGESVCGTMAKMMDKPGFGAHTNTTRKASACGSIVSCRPVHTVNLSAMELQRPVVVVMAAAIATHIEKVKRVSRDLCTEIPFIQTNRALHP